MLPAHVCSGPAGSTTLLLLSRRAGRLHTPHSCNTRTSSKVDAIRGVQMGPGATAFTLMPLLTSWLDRERVKATCAAQHGRHGGDYFSREPTSWLLLSSRAVTP
jgi:hypothetical protein